MCVDNPVGADKIVELVKAEFPLARLLVRSFDRGHTLRLIEAGVDYQIRETFESALAFGEAALRELGVAAEEAAEIVADVRRRDEQRLELQIAEGLYAGRDLVRGAQPVPTPLSVPKRPSQPLSAETAVVACVRRMSVEPKVGTRPAPRLVSTVMRLTRSSGGQPSSLAVW